MAESGINDIASLFHGTLFAYQKTLRNKADDSSKPIQSIIEELGDSLLSNTTKYNEGDFEKVFNGFAEKINPTGAAKVRLEKVSPMQYNIHVEDCMWAKHIHHHMRSDDVTCPYALVTMAMLQKVTGRDVSIVNSKYQEQGTVTEVRPVSILMGDQ
jgi:hypothetical protein